MNLDAENRRLSRAEHAAMQGGATSFLRELLRETGDETGAVGLSPADLVRAAQGKQPLHHRLDVLASASQPLRETLRAGDWLVRAVPGIGDAGHVAVLSSGELLTPSALAAEGIEAEGTQPGYYGLVIEAGAFPHTRSRRFARRLVDGRGLVPPHTAMLRPRYPDDEPEIEAPAESPGDGAQRDWAHVPGDERMAYVMRLLVEKYGYPVNGAAGIVGNLREESGVLPSRIEGSDAATPMRARDFRNVVTDFTPEQVMNRNASANEGPQKPGIGLAQWTTAARRSGLFRHSFEGQVPGAAILDSMDAQVDYLVAELRSSYRAVDAVLRRPDVSVEAASDEVVYNFEVPGAILSDERPRRKLPREHASVQQVFRRRRASSAAALRAYGGSLPAPRQPQQPPQAEQPKAAVRGDGARPNVSAGQRGESVRELQLRLHAIPGAPLKVDGVFGTATRDAVLRFQEKHRLPANGTVDRHTWDALLPLSGGAPLDDAGIQKIRDAIEQSRQRHHAGDAAGALKINSTLYADPVLAGKPELRAYISFNTGTNLHRMGEFAPAIERYLEAAVTPGGLDDLVPFALERIREARLKHPPTSLGQLRRRAVAVLGRAGTPTAHESVEEDAPAALAELGNTLWQEAPAGVRVAIYYDDPEQKRRAIDWGERLRAIGPRAGSAELAFGRAIADARNLGTQIQQLGTRLKAAVDAVPKPADITPLPDTGPQLIRTLALFTHGTNTWISIGGGISASGVGGVIERIAPWLTEDVTVIVYGCSAARGTKEASDWVTTTMTPGGEDSLAARFRDALVDAGKSQASVWSHTEVGHTTRNPSLRYFNAGSGKAARGSSYVGDFVFGTVDDIIVLDQLVKTVRDLGFAVDTEQEAKLRDTARRELRRLRYLCNLAANIRDRTVGGRKIRENNLTYRGGNLSEMAPVHPLDVASIVQQYWSDSCWSEPARQKFAATLARRLKLARS